MLKLNKTTFSLLLFVLISLLTACLPLAGIKKALEQKQPVSNQPIQPQKDVLADEFDLQSEQGKLQHEVYQLLMKNDFTAIEKLAGEVRKNKSRMLGGSWKITAVYDALTTIFAEYPGQRETDELWQNRIELLKLWKEKSPKSITPRVALASAYINYGWFARGGGYINTVSEENLRLLEERLALAENELFEAKRLDEKCPRWYREALVLGRTNGWSSEDFNTVFDEAVKFEPNFLSFYVAKAENSKPKWGGKQEDWQKFVDSIPSKVSTLGSDEGNIIYFLTVASALTDNSLSVNYSMISKERIREGYLALEKKYGVADIQLNQYAFLATLTNDFASAQEAFQKIGANYHKDVWGEQTFNMMKNHAEGKPQTPQK